MAGFCTFFIRKVSAYYIASVSGHSVQCTSHSKFVNSLLAQVWSVNFTIFSKPKFWRVFAHLAQLCGRQGEALRNFPPSLHPSIHPTTDYGHPLKAYIKEIWKIGPMWKTKYASAVPKNLGVGVDFGRAVKAISSPAIRSPCIQLKATNVYYCSLNQKSF